MRKVSSVFAVSIALLIGSTSPAVAAETSTDDVSVSVQPGSLSVEVSTLPTFAGVVPEAGKLGTATASETVNVLDQRGNGAGYRVIQKVQQVTYTGSAPEAQGEVLAPEDFTASYDLTRTSLDSKPLPQAQWPAFGPSLYTGNLGTGQTIIVAAPGTGMGSYRMKFGMTLKVPQRVLAGDYTATLTTSVVSGTL